MRRIDGLVIHCTATPEGKDYDVEDIRRMHTNKGWSDIGYHYLIRLDGTLENGRPIEKMGAHVRGHNKHTIGLVYVGGVDSGYNPKDTRTIEQRVTILDFIKVFRKEYPNAWIKGHRDLSPDLNNDGVIDKFEWVKVCPCFDVKKLVNDYEALYDCDRLY